MHPPSPVGWWPGDVVLYAGAVLVAVTGLTRATRGPRRRMQHVSHLVRKGFYDFVGWPAVVDPRTGEQKSPAVPGLGERMSNLEAAVRVGGQINELVDGQRAMRTEVDRGVRRASDAAVLAGEAATVAARADQRLLELNDAVEQRHAENTNRFAALESRDRALLRVLRDRFGIEIREGDE